MLFQVLSMSDELRRALYANSAISLDVDVIVPDLVGTTEILSDEHREHLCRHLPARAEGYLWTLVFSTSQHGFSLNRNNESLAIGAGDGKFGLWLDGDLYQGRTQSCSTYGNEPLAPHEDFVVKTLECWAFI
ncbi:hypothetical protein G9C98_005277 [Cotesia typhae]|uniref:Oxidation resistance protein 1 n=1 Tax=Cotesia typhae TaxID=2053667 RepID=A0A8J5QYQ2_9HYME|nr:hypothetical protein G9C98_005277 [Cotesia typhae]